jgi:hypothetical protein
MYSAHPKRVQGRPCGSLWVCSAHGQRTDNEPTTNRERTDNEPTTNRKRTDNEPKTNRQQTDNEPTTNRQRHLRCTALSKYSSVYIPLPLGDANIVYVWFRTRVQPQTDNGPTSNRQRTDNEPTTNRQRTDNGRTTNQQRTDNGPTTDRGVHDPLRTCTRQGGERTPAQEPTCTLVGPNDSAKRGSKSTTGGLPTYNHDHHV